MQQIRFLASGDLGGLFRGCHGKIRGFLVGLELVIHNASVKKCFQEFAFIEIKVGAVDIVTGGQALRLNLYRFSSYRASRNFCLVALVVIYFRLFGESPAYGFHAG